MKGNKSFINHIKVEMFEYCKIDLTKKQILEYLKLKYKHSLYYFDIWEKEEFLDWICYKITKQHFSSLNYSYSANTMWYINSIYLALKNNEIGYKFKD